VIGKAPIRIEKHSACDLGMIAYQLLLECSLPPGLESLLSYVVLSDNNSVCTS
jgi:hypothetical protein